MRLAVGTALAIWVFICCAVALVATYVAGALISVFRDGVAEHFVVLVALISGDTKGAARL